MSRDSWVGIFSNLLFGKSQDDSLSVLSEEIEYGTEEEGETDNAMIEAKRLRREIGQLKKRVGRRDAEIARLKTEGERLMERYRRRGEQIAQLEYEIGKRYGFRREDAQRGPQRLRAAEERLKHTEELLATRTAELAGAQAFLSTADRLSEEEVLNLVRNLNENIYQVAVNLTEEWEKYQSSGVIDSADVDSTSLAHAPALVQLVRNRDSVGLTFLLQLRLCSQVAGMTSRWSHHPELATLGWVYQQLCDSGEHCNTLPPAAHSLHFIEGQAVSAGWRSLTHTYLSLPPPHPAPLVEELANVLNETGSFSSKQQSLELVEATALVGIESIIQLALRLERAFMTEVSSSDVFLLFETPGTIFDKSRMANEIKSGGAPTDPGQGNEVAGVTELGVGKGVSGGRGKSRRVDILLKTKVVLEKDVMGLQKSESCDRGTD